LKGMTCGHCAGRIKKEFLDYFKSETVCRSVKKMTTNTQCDGTNKNMIFRFKREDKK